MSVQVDIIVMSGVYDGDVYTFTFEEGDEVVIRFGRDENSEVSINSDATVSRNHASIAFREGLWWLEDHDSKNGTFIENPDSTGHDIQVYGITQLKSEQLFRTGKTWFRFQYYEWHASSS